MCNVQSTDLGDDLGTVHWYSLQIGARLTVAVLVLLVLRWRFPYLGAINKTWKVYRSTSRDLVWISSLVECQVPLIRLECVSWQVWMHEMRVRLPESVYREHVARRRHLAAGM